MPFSRTRGVCWIASLLFAVWGNPAHAAGLGSIVVQSGFGQPLRVSVPLIGASDDDPDVHCIRARIASIDGSVSMTPRVGLIRSADAATIQISTDQSVHELALNVFVNIGCDVSVQRTYQILIDPAIMLPAMKESRAPDARSAQSPRISAPAAAFAADNASSGENAARRRASSRRHTRRHRAAPDRDADSAQGKEKAKPRRHKIARREAHSVLRMSGLDTPIEDLLPEPGLKISVQLSGNTETDPQKLAEIKRDQARFAAYLRGEDAAQTAEDRLKAAQAEVEKLHAEVARADLRRQSDKAAFESTQMESRRWIRSLQVLLAFCVLALAWLIWRFYAIKRDETHTSWRDLLGDHSDGDTTTFGSFGTNTSTFGTGAFSTTEFNTLNSNTAPPGAATQATAAPEPRHRPAGIPAETHKTTRSAPLAKKNEAASEGRQSVPFKYQSNTRVPYTRWQQTETRNHDPEHFLKVEEISDVMELANVWMAMHDPQKVLELLEPFSGVEQPESPLPWLCLLDVYHSIGDRKKYEAILERIKKIYNVKLAPWDTEADAEPPKTLADFPHIVETVLNLWEGNDIVPYLETLMKDNREGTRQGFDLPVYRDIIRLLALANDTASARKREDAERDIADAISAASQKKQAAIDATARSKTADIPREKATPEPPSPERKPQLRERPKYITTSYQRNIGARRNASLAEARQADSMPATADTNLGAAQSAPVETADAPESAADAQSANAEAKSDYEAMSPMAIKLHLAIAYVDIGDKEGAQLLLEEVIQGGNAEQVEQAKSLLPTLQ